MTYRAAIWHDVECGSYDADLALWEELTRPGDEVLDIGCGTGRVALQLARRGRRVTALDRVPELLEVLDYRAERAGLGVATVHAEARDFDLGAEFDAVFAPMQFVQLFHGAAERAEMLARAAAHLRPGGTFATTIMNLEGELLGDDYGPPPPDMREVDKWVYSSLPVGVRLVERGGAIVIERVRTAVSPEGRRSRSVDEVRLELVAPADLEAEIAAAGMTVVERRDIPATEDHVASVVVVASRPEAP
jgi:SAM-dependent methyltransferase